MAEIFDEQKERSFGRRREQQGQGQLLDVTDGRGPARGRVGKEHGEMDEVSFLGLFSFQASAH